MPSCHLPLGVSPRLESEIGGSEIGRLPTSFNLDRKAYLVYHSRQSPNNEINPTGQGWLESSRHCEISAYEQVWNDIPPCPSLLLPRENFFPSPLTAFTTPPSAGVANIYDFGSPVGGRDNPTMSGTSGFE